MNDLNISSNRKDTMSGRFYILPDRKTKKPVYVPSVTTILGILGKPALVNWAANQERALCTDAAYTLIAEADGLTGIDRDTFNALFADKLGRAKAYRRTMDQAANIGTEAHKAAEWTFRKLAGEKVGVFPTPSTEGARLAFAAFEAWVQEHDIEVLGVEQVVGSLDHGYAGTLDALLKIDGVVTLADLKTSKGVYDEHYLQLAAYDGAVREMVAKDGWECPLPEDHIIIRLPKTSTDPGFELHRLPAPVGVLHATFLDVLAVWNALNGDNGWKKAA